MSRLGKGSMLNGLPQLALPLFAVSGACAVTIAVAGLFIGTRGATLATLALWVAVMLALQYSSLEFRDPQRYWIFNAVVAAISLSIIFLPMLFLRNYGWIRGRLVGGLVGAAIAALGFVPLVLSLGCIMGIDCI